MSRFIRIALATALASLTFIVPSAYAGDGDVVQAADRAPVQHVSDSLAAARLGGPDSDGDGQDDYEDNCSAVANPDQLDTDADGFGNLCDADLNNDGVVSFVDLGILKTAFFATPAAPNWNPNADFNGDDVINFSDLGLMREGFFLPPGPSGMACAGSAPCPALRLLFEWPMGGQDADDWVINNYVDLDAGGGILDYAGGAKTYDGHRGVDIDVPTFRSMDNNFPVFAVAEGTVLALDDSHFDRNTTCVGNWNFVTVGHPNGWKTIYGHLKQNSVVVNVGDVVQPGTTLGVVGSSGCSTAPHLHLETQDDNGVVIEPFAQGMWVNPPVYATPIGFMDATLYNATINNVDMIKDPPPNVNLVAPGTTFGIGLSMGGGISGDSVNLRITKFGALVAQNTINWPGELRHSYWWWNYTFAAAASGPHELQIRVNGALVATYPFNVEQILNGFRQVRHGVPAANYQALFNQMVANGYRLIWIDGYQVSGNTFFNVIFDQSPVASWSSAHGLDGPGLQTYFDAQVQAGRRMVHIDSYRQGNAIRYAPIFVQQAGTDWVAYNNVTTAQHQVNFNDFVAQGFRASIISLAEDGNGVLRVTALYDKDPVGGWAALANLSSAQYQNEFVNQANAGRALAYLNVYSLNGSPAFSGIWNSLVPNSWVSQHNLSSAGFQAAFDNWEGQGLGTRLVTGYDNGAGTANFAGLWTD